MKHLLLCRHAKSSWKDGSLPDFDRPLNKRGRQNAPEMGKRLRKRGVIPELMVSSPARRALDTAQLLLKGMDCSSQMLVVVNDVYDSYPAKLMQIIQTLDDSVSTVLLVGHNPEITMLANMLGAPDLDNVPTGGIVAFDFSVSAWAQVDEGGGNLVFIDYPRRKNGD